jgi:radical SAM protein with 4Fe4S-binding SPASM domain
MKALLDAIRYRPRTCVMEITFKCNLKCLHCASNVNAGFERRGTQLTLPELTQVINDLHSLGCEHIVLSGGEALLSDNWEQITHQIVKHGIRPSLISNGFIIDAGMARRIRDAGIVLVALSIDGIEPTHNYIRNHPQSFARVLRAARSLVSANIRVNFVTTVTKANLNELQDIEDVVVSLSANRWLVQLGSPIGRLVGHPELVVECSDLPVVADAIVAAKRRNRVRIAVGDNIGYYSHHEQELRATPQRGGLDFFCGCSAGCLNVGIESNGNVKGCLSLQDDRFIEGNVRQESLKIIWHKSGSFAYNREFKLPDLKGSCAFCEYAELCRGGCKFMAFGATGSPFSNPYCLRNVTEYKQQEPDPASA